MLNRQCTIREPRSKIYHFGKIMLRNMFAFLNGLAAMVTWFFRESIKSWFFDKVVHQMNPWESALIEYGIPVAFGGTCIWLLWRRKGSSVATLRAEESAPSGKPELKVLICGGNVFTPEIPDLRDTHTGIALDVKVWNTGTPSVATEWNLNVIVPGRIPVRGQLTKIPDWLRLGGEFNSVVIRSSQSLERMTAASRVDMTPIEGTLLFYVAIKKDTVMQSPVALEVSVRDVFGVETVAMQRMGDWMRR